jgi:cobalt-zinc-cadmium efflux system membrane fusion protein
MKFRLLVLTVVLAATTGCGRCGGTGPSDDHADERETPSETAAADHSASNELQLANDVLRDVRITTAPVESRAAAASSSTLVGELRVNEERYGEVVTPVAGRVSRVFADIGQRVKAGQSLAEIQSTELGRATAAYFSAQARLQLARSTLQRKQTLAAEKIAPLREVQEAQADVDAAEAELRSARAELNALGISPPTLTADDADSSRLILRAPLSGVVIDRNVVVGQAADGEAPLFRVGDLSTLWLIVHAFERDAVRVSPGAQAAITFAAFPGETFSGRVILVGRQVNVESRTVPLRIEVQNPGAQLRPGMSASVVLPLGEATENVLTVPIAALQRLSDEWVVFIRIEREEGHFEIRPVGRGREFGTEIEIVRGVNSGESVVVEGAFVLKAEAEKARGQGADANPH